jgi:hypothetical protein
MAKPSNAAKGLFIKGLCNRIRKKIRILRKIPKFFKKFTMRRKCIKNIDLWFANIYINHYH